ncbi:LanC-like protein 3-like protein [Aphelenchoides besseyi]|nr:LanC-like protein 3-like protein [Aphelenchoides besseyi]
MCWNRKERSIRKEESESKMNSIPLKPDHKRFFTNPCFHDPNALAQYCTDKWLEEMIEQLSFRLMNRQMSREECQESGPYVGCAGIGYAMLKAGQTLPEKLITNVEFCNQLLASQFKYAKDASKSRQTRYLCGTLGLHVVEAISRHMSGRSIESYGQIFSSFVDTVTCDGYQRIGDDDVLNGRSGFLLAVQQIKKATGYSVLSDAEIQRVLKAIIHSGRRYSRQHHSPAPLFYQWHQKEYLGAAHGLSGVLQALLSFWDLLAEDERVDVKQTLDWFCSIQQPDGNFPSSSGHIAGVIHLLIQALVLFSEDHYLQSAKRCVELIWYKGVLRKGCGLCHGVAGNGYAMLLLYRVVNDPTLLERAKAFALIMMDQKFEQLSNVPDSPYSLFEGWAGALCFLIDLHNPGRAQFPLLPINFGANSM